MEILRLLCLQLVVLSNAHLKAFGVIVHLVLLTHEPILGQDIPLVCTIPHKMEWSSFIPARLWEKLKDEGCDICSMIEEEYLLHIYTRCKGNESFIC